MTPLLARQRAGKEHECLFEAPGKSWRKDATSKAMQTQPAATVKALLCMRTPEKQHFPQAPAWEAAREQSHVRWVRDLQDLPRAQGRQEESTEPLAPARHAHLPVWSDDEKCNT